jgi:hypothetical protein
MALNGRAAAAPVVAAFGGKMLGRSRQHVHHSSFRDTLALVTAAPHASSPPRVGWPGHSERHLSWSSMVLSRLLLEADVPEERENDRIDLFRSLFRRLVTNARHDDDVAQIAEIRSERLESGALPVDAEHWLG